MSGDAMTDEELDAIEAMARKADAKRRGYPQAIEMSEMVDAVTGLLASVRRLKARASLPVLASCSECASCHPERPLADPVRHYCSRLPGSYVNPDAAPPKRCPKRGR
jgi:hypothetical protein